MRISPPPQGRLGTRPNGHPRQYPILGYLQRRLCPLGMDKSIYSVAYQRLCALLREIRTEAGLTQVQVAQRLDEPQSFVSKYESGERRLDVVELSLVADALGTTLANVILRFEESSP